jgi:hypothetical protein
VQPAPARQPLPSLQDVLELRIEAGPGGPAQRRCGGKRDETTIVVASGAWKKGRCDDATPRGQPSPTPDRPLSFRTGKLTVDQRAALEAAYAKVTQRPGPSCAPDAGALRLKLTLRGGQKLELADPLTSCAGPGDTPPPIADDLRELDRAVSAITTP